MNQTIKLINDIFPYAIIVLMLVASYFEYAKKNDPQVADKLKHIGTFAEWAVSLQDTMDKPNPEKLHDATQAVLQQANQVGIKLTEEMARGAVEHTVAVRKNASDKLSIDGDKFAKAATDRTKEAMTKNQAIRPEDLASGEIKGVSLPKPAEPVSDDNAQLDDLEPKE